MTDAEGGVELRNLHARSDQMLRIWERLPSQAGDDAVLQNASTEPAEPMQRSNGCVNLTVLRTSGDSDH